MERILHIETSTSICSVGLSEGDQMVASCIDTQGQNHSKLIGVFTQEVLQKAGWTTHDLSAVALSVGPGSYTGLRIGTSFAKGICFGSNLPIITLPTLQILAQAYLNTQPPLAQGTLLCPMIDARRMEVYTAAYNTSLQEVKAAWPEILDENSYQEFLAEHPVVFLGNGMEKSRKVLTHPNAQFAADIIPTAEAMLPLARQAYQNKQFADVAYFEPLYVKEFMATVPKNKIF